MSPLDIEALPGFKASVRVNGGTEDGQVGIIGTDGETRSVNHQESFTLGEGEILVLPDGREVQAQIGEEPDNNITIIKRPSFPSPEKGTVVIYARGELGTQTGEKIPSTLSVHTARAGQLTTPVTTTAGEKMRIRVSWREK